jgi:gluconolactonase
LGQARIRKTARRDEAQAAHCGAAESASPENATVLGGKTAGGTSEQLVGPEENEGSVELSNGTQPCWSVPYRSRNSFRKSNYDFVHELEELPMRMVLLSISVAAAALTVASAQPSSQKPTRTAVRLDAALDQILSTDARLQILKADYFGIAEGPVWIPQGRTGYLLFSDVGANVIYKWTPDGMLSVFMEKSGYTGDLAGIGFQGFGVNDGRLYVLNLGSNGIVTDPQGRLIFDASGDRAIVRIEKDGKRTVLADRYEGKRLNRPNDLVLKSDGAIYFSDPRPANNPLMELPTSAVFLIKDGAIRLLLNDYRTPNGLAFSPDEKYLYVNDTLRNLIMRYDVQPDDTIANGRLFIDMNEDKAPGNPDGMKVDARGNVYCMGPGGIWILSPEGKHLGTILLPDIGTNMTFGGPDGKMLYITSRRGLMRIPLKVAGALWKAAR